jgi:hypothetical protein
MKNYLLVACLVGGSNVLWAQVPRFDADTIDAEIQIGYGLAIGEVNGDGHTDILLADKEEIVWYQNPGSAGKEWARHVMARKLTQRDNVCVAARDIDGDGLVEVAVGANWNPSETSDIQQSGAVFYLQRPADSTQLWSAMPITPYDPTTHRMHWIRVSNDDFSLVVLPLHGRGNRDGQGEPVRVMAYSPQTNKPNGWTSRVLNQSQHMTHNFDPIPSADQAGGESMLVGGHEGIIRLASDGTAETLVANPPSRGAGEVRAIRVSSESEFAAIEPMHGNEVVFYRKEPGGSWARVVIDSSVCTYPTSREGIGSGTLSMIIKWHARISNWPI